MINLQAKISHETLGPDGKTRIIVSTVCITHPQLSTRLSTALPHTKAGEKLAKRFAVAIDAGAAYPNARVATDVNGNKYITHDIRASGRNLNADLKRLGF